MVNLQNQSMREKSECALGVDMFYQSLPVDCDLIDRARKDPAYAKFVGMLWLMEEGHERYLHPDWRRQSPEMIPPRDWMADWIVRSPGLRKRNLDSNRTWDVLHYLLSANRRGEQGNEHDRLIDVAVLGAMEIGTNITGGQGHPIRYAPADEVRKAAAVLEPMTVDTLATHFKSQNMLETGIYKFRSDCPDEYWPGTVDQFQKFRSFFLEAAQRGEYVIALLH